MSTMLEQAIVDAKALREAAVKSAEAAIVEKYNDEVKDAVSKLLEQDDEMSTVIRVHMKYKMKVFQVSFTRPKKMLLG